MKKLIALAVAAASVPAMAAVTISGQTEVSYSNTDAKVAGVSVAGGTASTAAAKSKTLGTEDTSVTFAASSELDNGMAISTSYTLFSAGNAVSNDGGEGAITIAGSFGGLSVGDVAGPLDARDGQAAATAANDLSAAFGNDMAVVYTLPTLVEGLNISAGMAPKNGGDTGVVTDGSSVAFDYSVAGFKVYAGVEESTTTVAAVTGVDAIYISTNNAAFVSQAAGTTAPSGYTLVSAGTKAVAADKLENEITGYGVSYTINGLTVAANFAEKEVKNAAGTVTKHEASAYGVAYTTGALTLAYNSKEDETGGMTTEEQDTASVSYNLGGGASVYAATTDREKAKNDETTVGIKFAF